MSGRSAPQPAWAKLVAVAAVVVAVWILDRTIGPVLLVFTVSTVVALLLNPVAVVVKEAAMSASGRRGSGAAVVAASFPAAGSVSRLIPTRALDAPGLRPER